MKINISTAEDIQHYMNELQNDENNPDVVRSDKYDEEKLTNFVPVHQIVRWIDNLRKTNDMWKYTVDECFGMLEDTITSDSKPKGSTHNKGYSQKEAIKTLKEYGYCKSTARSYWKVFSERYRLKCSYPKCNKVAEVKLGMNDPDAEMIPYCKECAEKVKMNTYMAIAKNCIKLS